MLFDHTLRDVSHEMVHAEFIRDELSDLIDGFYFLIDKNVNFHLISPSIKEELGYSPEEIKGCKLTDLLPAESSADFLDSFKIFRKDKGQPAQKLRAELLLLDKDGNSIWYKMVICQFGSEALWKGLCLNIDSQKKHEEQIIKERDTAIQNDKLKSESLSNMSHEIRTPLNGIIGFSSMINKENLTSEKRQKYMCIIRSSSRHLLTLINDIIDLSKIEAGQLVILSQKVNVGHMLDELLSTFKSEKKRLQKEHIFIAKQVPIPDIHPEIITDETRLRQVMVNLLGNALKFTDEGSIEFGYTLNEDGSLCFFVRDTGSGISPELANKVFRRYKQSNECENAEHQGKGLGLAISKGLVELMGGTLKLYSKPGKGSEFYFTLPIENQ